MAEFHLNASVLVLWVLAHHHGFTGTLRAIVNITNNTYFHKSGKKKKNVERLIWGLKTHSLKTFVSFHKTSPMLDKPSSHTIATTNSHSLLKEQTITGLTKHLETFKGFVKRMNAFKQFLSSQYFVKSLDIFVLCYFNHFVPWCCDLHVYKT